MGKVMLRILVVLFVFLSTGVVLAMASPQFKVMDCIDIGATATDGLKEILGPEDLALARIRGTDIIVVSSHDRKNKKPEGGFFAIDTKTGQYEQMEIDWGGAPRQLRPHGVDVLNNDDGSAYLYAINHPHPDEVKQSGHEVLAFKIEKSKLQFSKEKSVSHALLVSPNDLTVLTNGDLFVTNLLDDSPKVWGWFKTLIGLKYGNVVHINSTSKSVNVVFKASMPNGVLADEENGKLLVATSRGNTFYVLDFDPITGKVNGKPEKTFAIKGGDNITSVPGVRGEVLVASHPKLFRFMRHSNNTERDSPSRILRVNYLGSSEPEILFEDDGSRFSAASTGLIHNGYLYVGQVFRAGVFRCRLN